MRVSGWLLLLQQSFCTWMILRACMLRMRAHTTPLRTAGASLAGGILSTLSLWAGHTGVRILCCIIALCMPCCLLRRLPRPIALGSMLPALALTLVSAGLIGAFSPTAAAPMLLLLLPVLL